MAAVNCEGQAALCQQQRVQGYPSIKALVGGQLQDYGGDRSARHLKQWALGLLPNHVRQVANSGQLEGLLRQCAPGAGSASRWSLCLLLLTPKHATSALYKSLALRYKGRVVFGEVRGAAVGGELDRQLNVTSLPALLAFCGGSTATVIPYTGGWLALRGAVVGAWCGGGRRDA